MPSGAVTECILRLVVAGGGVSVLSAPLKIEKQAVKPPRHRGLNLEAYVNLYMYINCTGIKLNCNMVTKVVVIKAV